MRISERFTPGSESRRRLVVRAMQGLLVVFVCIGLVRMARGEEGLGVVVNASVALGVTFVPGALEREYDLPMNPGLTLWISSAVFLHALGTVGIPGLIESFYGENSPVPFYDHLTHGLSASVVAATGYTVARAIDEHTDAVSLPPRFMFVFILQFVLAFGVAWEVLEFGISGVASLVGSGSVLTQYGLDDTLLDLIFDTVGGIVVAVWGTAHLTDLTTALSRRFDRSRRRRDARE